MNQVIKSQVSHYEHDVTDKGLIPDSSRVGIFSRTFVTRLAFGQVPGFVESNVGWSIRLTTSSPSPAKA